METGNVDYNLANTHPICNDDTKLRAKSLQETVSAHISNVHHMDWFSVVFGCLDDHNRRYETVFVHRLCTQIQNKFLFALPFRFHFVQVIH